MSKSETILGLTPIMKRLAYHFLCRGFGRYKIKDHPFYDEAEVKELYPWMPNPENQDEYGGAIIVSFFKKGRRIRFVEFGTRFIGGGGDETIRRVK